MKNEIHLPLPFIPSHDNFRAIKRDFIGRGKSWIYPLRVLQILISYGENEHQ
jgi:hypothetical protein